jgi:threonine synthase
VSLLENLACGRCDESHEATRPQTVCTACGAPLLARYDLDGGAVPSLEEVLGRPAGQFRLPELLPNTTGADTPTLGEGATPLLSATRIAPELGVAALLVKDESQNPTASFKARGMAVAVARARELGGEVICLPSAGNAGAAAAAYGALHGLEVCVAIPKATPEVIVRECEAVGASVVRLRGTIADCGRWIAEEAASQGWLNLATLREPYRIEGKKVMGYELFWELGRLPDVIVYPTGGGTGLIGMAKAFDEMQALGWIGPERPRFVAVQLAGCAPIVRAFDAGEESARPWEDPQETSAYGLRVPSAIGDFLMLRALRDSGGTAVAVSEESLRTGANRIATSLGLWPSPEGGACMAAADRLAETGWLRPEDTVVLFNTGSPLTYL